MEPSLSAILNVLSTAPTDNPVAMDDVHAMFIASCVMTQKPERVLELGIGSGLVTRTLLASLSFNGRGILTSVDNFCDWGGVRPPHVDDLSRDGARIVVSDEEEFLQRASGQYDLIVSDGDHLNAHKTVGRIFSLAREGAFLFFHDTNNSMFPNLRLIVEYAKSHGYSLYEFTERSRPGERTERGLLFVVKRAVDRSRMSRRVRHRILSLVRKGRWYLARVKRRVWH